MQREMKIYFPEYKEALGKVDGAFSLGLLKHAPFPDALITLGEDGIRQIWHDAKLRGRGYSRAGKILQYAKASVGIRDGAATGETAVKWFVEKIMELDAEPAVIKEIQKLNGLGLVACSSGKHKGETKISHRGRRRLRYWLFQAAKSAVAHAEEFKELHMYYTTRAGNPLKKMQSLIVIACRILRIIYTILKNGTVYDPKKMLMDIRRPKKKEATAA